MGGFFLPLTLLGGLSMVGCSHQTSDEHAIFKYNEPTGIPTLDPAFAKDKSTLWAVGQLYEGLVRLDTNSTVAPALAESWEISSDGLLYTFTLRSAQFHNGDPVTGKDVVFSLQRLTDPEVASPGKWTQDRVDTLWSHNNQVYIRLQQPFAPFLSMLSMAYCSVVSEDHAKSHDLANAPNGTGPFKFHKWWKGEKLIFHKNQHYWETDANGQPLPKLDAISIRFIPDAQSAFLEFLKGSLNFLPTVEASFKDDLLGGTGSLQERYSSRFYLEKATFLNTEYLVFNAEAGIPRDLRWAVNAAIDRDLMMAKLRNGIGLPAHNGIVPTALPGSLQGNASQYNPDSAQAIIAAHHSAGTLPPLELSTVSSYLDLCEYVQGSLAKVGWTITVNVLPPSSIRAQKSTGELDFFRASWIADYPDAENYLMLFYGPNSAPSGPNYSRVNSTAYNALYEQLVVSTHEEERIAVMQRAGTFIYEQALCVPLYYDQSMRVMPNELHSVKGNALNQLILNYAYLK